jgi:hypothetical protein
MGKYNRFQVKTKVKKGLHPIWRGIGCLLIVIVIAIAYGLTRLLVPQIIASGYIPWQVAGPIRPPEWAFSTPLLSTVSYFLASLHNPWVNLITFGVTAILLTGITSLIYAAVYSAVGPQRYTSKDAPPSRYKPKKYTR